MILYLFENSLNSVCVCNNNDYPLACSVLAILKIHIQTLFVAIHWFVSLAEPWKHVYAIGHNL